MLANPLRILHSGLIIYLFCLIFSKKTYPVVLVLSELLLTILRSAIEKRTNSTRTKIQISLSFMLGYGMFPNKFQTCSWFFFAKIIEVHQSLK